MFSCARNRSELPDLSFMMVMVVACLTPPVDVSDTGSGALGMET